MALLLWSLICTIEIMFGSEPFEDEKGNVDILRDLFIHNSAIQQHTDKRRPHIQKVKTVKAMRYNENIRGKRGAVRTCTGEKNDQRAG